MKIKLTKDARRSLNIVNKFEFNKFKVFGDNMAALFACPRKFFWDMPTIVGATKFDQVKHYLYQFRLPYRDTHSLLYWINWEDLYREMKDCNVLDQLVFSNHPGDHEMHSEENEHVVLIFSWICLGLKTRVSMPETSFPRTQRECFHWLLELNW